MTEELKAALDQLVAMQPSRDISEAVIELADAVVDALAEGDESRVHQILTRAARGVRETPTDTTGGAGSPSAARPTSGVRVRGLADLGSIDTPWERPAVVTHEGDLAGGANREDEPEEIEENDEITARPVDLVLRLSPPVALSAWPALRTDLLATLAGVAGAYEALAEDGEWIERVALRALGDSEEWVGVLEAGSVIFDNLVTGDGQHRAIITVAGEANPENPMANPVGYLNGLLAEMDTQSAAEGSEPIAAPRGIGVKLRRKDGVYLDDDALAAPLAFARANLEAYLGTTSVRVVNDTPDGARIAWLDLETRGDLDARVLSLWLARFEGTKEFPGLGLVEAVGLADVGQGAE